MNNKCEFSLLKLARSYLSCKYAEHYKVNQFSPGHIEANGDQLATKNYRLNRLSIQMIGMFILIVRSLVDRQQLVYCKLGETKCYHIKR